MKAAIGRSSAATTPRRPRTVDGLRVLAGATSRVPRLPGMTMGAGFSRAYRYQPAALWLRTSARKAARMREGNHPDRDMPLDWARWRACLSLGGEGQRLDLEDAR